MGYPSPGQGTPGTAGSGPLNTSGNDGGVSSDCSDDEGSPGAGGGGGHMPVVYPWMKKIHVAGAGEGEGRVSRPAYPRIRRIESIEPGD
jgi:hypothetical protein